MKKVHLLVIAIVVVLLLSGGCTRHVIEEMPESREPVVYESNPDSAPYGIRLGKTFITDFYPGAYVDTLTVDDTKEGLYKKGDPSGIIIVNNLCETRHFRITVIQPNELEEGYSRAPDYVLEDWVRVSDPNPILLANETRLIPISLWMPPEAEVFADKWEFRIMVKDIDQTEFAQIAYEAKWFIEMK